MDPASVIRRVRRNRCMQQREQSTICSSGDRWSGIIQQHEEIVSGVFDTEKGREKGGILPSELVVSIGKSRDVIFGQEMLEAAGWWGKG